MYRVNEKHPNPEYSHIDRLTITPKDKQLRKLINDKIDELYTAYCTTNAPISRKKFLASIFTNPLDLIKVKDLDCPCNHKDLYECVLGHPEDGEVMSYKTCKHTIYGAAKRQMKAAPTPDPQVSADFFDYAKNIVDKEIGEQLTHFTYDYSQWMNHLTRAKQLDMQLVHDLIYNIESDAVAKLSPQRRQQLLTEVYEGLCKIELQSTDGKPRMVCSIPPKIKYTMGPITWQLEEICAHHFQGYCGGKNLQQMEDMINDYIDQGFTKVVEGDGSAFDNTQDVSLKAIDRYIYQRVRHAVYHVPVEYFDRYSQALTKTMSLKYRVNGKTKTLMDYTILGSVFSGDCDTTLMNTLRMALYNRYVNDKAGLRYGRDYVLFSKGDDFTVMYKPYVSNTFIDTAYYRYFLPSADISDPHVSSIFGLGQVLKFLEKGGPEIIKFCSLRAWLYDNEHIILTRNPAKFSNLAKYSIKTKSYTNTQLQQYLIDQGDAIMAVYAGLDYFETMAQIYYDHARHVPIKPTTYRKNIQRLMATGRLTRAKARYQNSAYDRWYYEIMGREEVEVLYEGLTWWESQKLNLVLNVSSVKQRLTAAQLREVNQQIAAEFDSEELKSILAR